MPLTDWIKVCDPFLSPFPPFFLSFSLFLSSFRNLWFWKEEPGSSNRACTKPPWHGVTGEDVRGHSHDEDGGRSPLFCEDTGWHPYLCFLSSLWQSMQSPATVSHWSARDIRDQICFMIGAYLGYGGEICFVFQIYHIWVVLSQRTAML